jgi:catalase
VDTISTSPRRAGASGPATLENYQFLEKISHFDRERIPERVVHARGFAAHGEFEATGRMIGDDWPEDQFPLGELLDAWLGPDDGSGPHLAQGASAA